MTDALTHLGPVEQTVVLPLLGRAWEAARPDAILRDSRAAEIVGALGVEGAVSPEAADALRGAVWRTALYDALVASWMASHPGGTVVELGCGFNDRFARVDDDVVHWRDLDTPAVAALWRRFVAASAFETGWVDALAAETSGPCLFVSEASTLFFPEADNRALLARLAARFPGACVLFDTVTSAFVRSQDVHPALGAFEARVTWAVDDPAVLEAWGDGYRLTRSFPLLDPPADLGPPMPSALRARAADLEACLPGASRAAWLHLLRL